MAAIDRALALYEREGKHPSIATRDHADAALEPQLLAAGWKVAIPLPGMVIDERIPDRPLPEGATLHHVDTEADRAAFETACLAGFAADDMDREAVSSALSTLDSLVGGNVAAYYVVVDDKPVSCALSSLDERIGLGIVGWVGTDPAYRRRGLGAAVTAVATNAGFDFGARWMGLQASPMGLPIYLKLGFRTIAGYKVWFKL